MVRNEQKYKQALEFRKRGFTYTEIARICDVSKTTVANWLAKEPFSQRIKTENVRRAAQDNKKRIALLNKARNVERKTRYAEAVKTAETEFRHYRKDPRFIAGLMVYASTGDLTDTHKLRLTSNRPSVHRCFIVFATEYLGVDKKHIQFWLLFSGNVNLEKETRLWSREISLPLARFGKPQFVNPTRKPLHKGTGNTIIGNTVLKKKILRWIELISKEF